MGDIQGRTSENQRLTFGHRKKMRDLRAPQIPQYLYWHRYLELGCLQVALCMLDVRGSFVTLQRSFSAILPPAE